MEIPQARQVGGAAVGQPHLGAVDHEIVPVGHRLGLDRGDVGAQVGLGHGERAAGLAQRHRRQVTLLLLLGAVLGDHVRHDEMRVDHTGHAHPAACDLLHDQGVGQQRLAEPAVLLRDGEPEQAHLLHPVDDVLRIGVGVLQLGRVRQDFLVHERLDRGQDLLLDLGETGGVGEPGHGCASSRRRGSTEYPLFGILSSQVVNVLTPGR